MLRGAQRPIAFGLALGLFATCGQVALMREALSVSGGNELALGLGLACWLAGVGLGALAAGLLDRPATGLLAGSLVGPLVLAGGLLLLRLHRALAALPPGGDPSLPLLAGLLAAGLGAGGLAVGFLFTSAARAPAPGHDRPVSTLYVAEGAGALLGGLVFALLLAGRLGHLEAIGAVAVPLLVVAAAIARRRFVAVGLLAAGVACGLGLCGPLPALDRWSRVRAFELARFGGELLADVDSPYGRLALGGSDGQYQLFADGRLDYAFPDPWERATAVHLALCQHPRPRSVLLVGGGAPDRVAAALAHHPTRVVLTHLDRAAHELAREHWTAATRAALGQPRVEIVEDDGRRYVAQSAERFDVVIVAARPPLSAQANRYHTREFFTAVRRILAPGGSVTVHAPGGANLLAPEAARATAAVRATVAAVFEETVIVPGLVTTIHAAVDPGVISSDPRRLAERFDGRRVAARSFSARRFETLLEPRRIAALERQLAAWPAELNTDARPLAYLANLQLWERSLGGAGTADDPTWTGRAERGAWLWLAAPLLLWLVWRLVRLGRRRRNGADAVFSIATTGAAGMAIEVVVLYVFQAASGQVYTGLALIIALFMAGLVGGALLGRRLRVGDSRRAAVLVDGVALALLIATGPVLGAALAAPWLVAGWSAVAGAVTGLAFPVLLVAAAGPGGDERRSAAAIEAADHLGAALGALVTGVIWLPVYGITLTCLMFAAFKGASLAGLLVGRSAGVPAREAKTR